MKTQLSLTVVLAALALIGCGAEPGGSGGGAAGGVGGGSSGGGAGGSSGAGGGAGVGGGAAGSGGGGAGVGGGTAGGGGGSGTGGGSGGGDLPCVVVNTLATHCSMCHGTVPAQNATFSILTRADLGAASAINPSQTIAQRSVVRMQQATAQMPPSPNARVPQADINGFSAWANAGMPAASCPGTGGGSGAGGGAGVGGGTGGAGVGGGTGGAGGGSGAGGGGGTGPAPTTCKSGLTWFLGNLKSAAMNPGLACRACHLGQNFDNQNPGHASNPSQAYFFMGTVFFETHTKNLCIATPPSGGTIEILDANGAVAQTISVTNLSGNFYSSSVSTSMALPYTARVTAGGKTATMTTPQTNGDCNTCHTEQGLNGAPGRIYWP